MTGTTAPENRFFPLEHGDRRVVVLDSATHARRHAATSDAPARTEIVVNASYAGVYCARLLEELQPRATIGLDCAIGKDGAGVAGLWFFEALGIPAAAVRIEDVEHGNGADLWENGIISRANGFALAAGVRPGMSAAEAAAVLLAAPDDIVLDSTEREIVYRGENGHDVVCTNSIADALPEDRDRNVLCTAGHTGRSVVDYIVGFRPWGFICSDGGMGKDASGIAALAPADAAGIPGAAVSASTARMGDGHSTYFDGVISACNELAYAAGVRVGQSAVDAARLLATR
ncbi:hypothetical protein ABXJ56_04280 [Microbacterium chocolatum]|uniref:hypothetical protein n=1 Tax=Microbacterium aurantiacum TaxID=162393 RepID=UPI00338EA630